MTPPRVPNPPAERATAGDPSPTSTFVRDQPDGWGVATLYREGAPVVPRLFTEADPIAGVLVDDWSDGATWGETTYGGRRRHRRSGGSHRVAPAPPETAPPGDVGAELGADGGATDTATGIASASDAATDAAADTERSTSRFLAASGSMAVASLVSRVTGFVRTALLLAALGSTGVATAYNSGNNLPNMIYELLLGGVLSSVLIPLLVQAQSRDDDDGVAYTQRLLSLATAALGAMTIVVVAIAPWIVAPFVQAGPRRELTTVFASLLLPEIFFYGLGAMIMAVLNIRQVYGPGAWSPVLNNVVVIAAVSVFWALPGPATLSPTSITTAQIVVVGVGTTVGIAAQALVLVPALRRTGFRWQWRFRARPNEAGRLREVGTLGAWVLGYVVVSQVGVSVIQRVGNDNGGFTIFTNADLLFQMPYGILVVSLLTAIMPRLSRAALRGDRHLVIADLSLASRLSTLAMLPVTAGLIALGPAFAVAVFANGQLTIGGAHLLGASLAWSAFGLLPFAVVMLQLRVFYAMRDGRMPTLINVAMVGTKVALVLATNEIYHGATAIEWLNISTSASYVVGALVGYVVLARRLGHLELMALVPVVLRVAVASAAGGAVAYLVVRAVENGWTGVRSGAALGLVGGALAGLAALVLVAWLVRLPELRSATAWLSRRTVRRG